ncbi:expressed unknown protein [Seminavis robusta]|uniref:Uncharacterized protein n=1 Tax=Seminavis robusta TaxID=568900 RepID=A0A9N8E854_9STRA|nr:expressed unknown protein [Seminavis robusta]|eukprot:Sro650_g181371.1  (157) ;mRNA; f:20076-20546
MNPILITILVSVCIPMVIPVFFALAVFAHQELRNWEEPKNKCWESLVTAPWVATNSLSCGVFGVIAVAASFAISFMFHETFLVCYSGLPDNAYSTMLLFVITIYYPYSLAVRALFVGKAFIWRTVGAGWVSGFFTAIVQWHWNNGHFANPPQLHDP